MVPILASKILPAVPVAGQTFDAAVATHVDEPCKMPAALGEVFRVLRSGGRLLVFDTDWASIVRHFARP